jgi:hypothetical protein
MDLRAYKCWFEFLKRSERYKECCAQGGTGELASLYEDFGNIHAAGLLWEDWWASHEQLFSGIEPLFVLNEIQSVEDFNFLWEEDQEDLLALVINLYAPKETILNAVEEAVARLQLELRRKENEIIKKDNPKAKVTERFGRPKLDPSFYHRYGLTPVPSSVDLQVLERVLEVYDWCTKDGQQLPKNRDDWFEKALDLGIMVEASSKSKMQYAPPSLAEERLQRAEKIKRYFRQAKEIIENVEKGIFPMHNG